MRAAERRPEEEIIPEGTVNIEIIRGDSFQKTTHCGSKNLLQLNILRHVCNIYEPYLETQN